jgi:hypothetical protein
MDASSAMSLTEQQQRIMAAWNRLSVDQELGVEIVLGEKRPPYSFKLGEARSAA